MAKYDYDDIVCIVDGAPAHLRLGCRAWIVGIVEERRRAYFASFPPGVVYTVEFEDGDSVDVHESYLTPATPGTPGTAQFPAL